MLPYNTSDQKSRTVIVLADFSLILMVVIWGSTFFMIKQHLDFVDPVGMLFYRFGLAALAVLIIVLVQKKNPFAHFKSGIVVGFFLWLIHISQNIGMQYTSASNSGFITALFVAFVPVLSITVYRRRPEVMRTFAALLSLIGLWFLTGGFNNLNKGDLITLIAPVSCSFYILFSDHYLKGEADPMVMAFQQFFIVCILSLFYMLILRLPFAVTAQATYGIIVYLALVVTVVTYTVYNYVQQISTPMKVTLIFALEPVFAAFFAYVFGGERFTIKQMLGGFLIVLAMLISELKYKKILKIDLGEDAEVA